MKIRTYSELCSHRSFEERFEYLTLRGVVGRSTFGFDRWVNQVFYTSRDWRQIRQHVIARDEGLDLAVLGYDIHANILIHHMNPITPEDIKSYNDAILDPDFLITTTHSTHNAIHYGDRNLLPRINVRRTPGDTKLW